VAKKKGMLSWLGFGKKEAKPSVEDKKEDNLPIEEVEQVTAAETAVQPIEQTPEQEISSPTVDETECVEAASVDAVEPIAEELKPAVEASVELELTPEENLLAEMEATEEVETVKAEATDVSSQETESEVTSDTVTEVIVEESQEETQVIAEPEPSVIEVKADSKPGFFARLKQGLSKTRQSLGGGLVDLFRGKQIDDDLFEELETHLLMADVGVEPP